MTIGPTEVVLAVEAVLMLREAASMSSCKELQKLKTREKYLTKAVEEPSVLVLKRGGRGNIQTSVPSGVDYE